MRRTFEDDNLQKQFEENGYVHMSLLSKKEVEQLRDIYNQHTYFQKDQPFLHTHLTNRAHRHKIHNLSSPHIQKPLLNILLVHKVCFSYFLAKKAGEKSEIDLHQDMTLVNEDQFNLVTAWIALTDMTKQNGCFHIVKKSHKFVENLRGPGIEWPYEEIKEEVENNYLTPIPMKAGEVIIFDQKMWHYSPSNQSNQDRVAAAAIAIPQEATFVHYRKNDNGLIDKYSALDHAFPLEYVVNEPLPENCQKESEFSYSPPKLDWQTFEQRYSHHNNGKTRLTNPRPSPSIWQKLKQKISKQPY